MKRALSTFLFILALRQARYGNYKLYNYFNDASYRLFPHPRNYNLKAAVFLELKDIDEAIVSYEKSIELSQNVEAYTELGNIYLRNDKIDQAIKFYEKSLLENPGYEEAWLGLVGAYFKQGEYVKVEKILGHLENTKYQLFMEFIYAKIYIELNKLELAKMYIDKVMPKSRVEGLYLLAKYQYLSDNISEAKNVIDQIDERTIYVESYDDFKQLKDKIYKKYFNQK